MKHCLLLMEQELARGMAVHVLLDISAQNPGGNYVVVLSYQRKVVSALGSMQWLQALELAEATIFAREIVTGWRDVLERCTRKAATPSHAGWDGSIGEYAGRRYKIGTWEWVQTLVEHRRQCEAGGLAA